MGAFCDQTKLVTARKALSGEQLNIVKNMAVEVPPLVHKPCRGPGGCALFKQREVCSQEDMKYWEEGFDFYIHLKQSL